MNLNDPVECHYFLSDQIKGNREGTWCVTLDLNGRILSLFGSESPPDGSIVEALASLSLNLQLSKAKQFIFVRITHGSTFFCSMDWMIVDKLKKISAAESIEFCDYLKINKDQHTSLLQFDY